jgi:hypothetical protein
MSLLVVHATAAPAKASAADNNAEKKKEGE